MPANTRGQRNIARKEAARQKKLTRRNAPQKKSSANKNTYYISKKNRSIRHKTTSMRSTRKSSKKEVNIKKIIGRLIVLLFQLKIDPVSLVKKDPELKQYFSGINLNVSRFGAKTPYSFPFPTSSTSSTTPKSSKSGPVHCPEVKKSSAIISSAPKLIGAPCSTVKTNIQKPNALVKSAAAVVMSFCPAIKYNVELFHPVCIDPEIQQYARDWAKKAGVGVAKLKNKNSEDDFCRADHKDICEAGLGVPRILMPSLDKPKSFLNRIDNQFHINYVNETTKMSNLIPAQGEIRQSRAEGAAKGMDRETGLVEVGKNPDGSPMYASPIIISQDNFIIDGHHRWAAAYMLGIQDRSIPVIRIQAPITSILMIGALEPANPF
jgi:hypothetical protein